MRLLACFLLIFAAGPLAAADLTPSVLVLADRPVLRGTSWAAAAAYTDGEEIFSLQPDLRLAPASALKLLTSPRAGVYTQAEAAQILGYSDQSHYTREFKEFSGVCPCQFQKQI